MMRSTPARVMIDTSVAASIGWPWCTRPPTPAYSPSVFSRTITQSRSAGPQRLSGASMPGRMRVGRTLAYWSKPWQIFRRRPHSVTWSGMCGSPADPNRMASIPRNRSSPSSGIITPCRRYQSPPQPKSVNSKPNPPRRCASASRTCCPAGTTSLPMPSPGMVAIRYVFTWPPSALPAMPTPERRPSRLHARPTATSLLGQRALGALRLLLEELHHVAQVLGIQRRADGCLGSATEVTARLLTPLASHPTMAPVPFLTGASADSR